MKNNWFQNQVLIVDNTAHLKRWFYTEKISYWL